MDKGREETSENAEIGRRIRQLCEQRGMSYRELAEQADISQAALYNILSGSANPRLSTLQLICKALDVSLGQLFSSWQGSREVSCMELKEMIWKLGRNERLLLKMYLELLQRVRDEF